MSAPGRGVVLRSQALDRCNAVEPARMTQLPDSTEFADPLAGVPWRLVSAYRSGTITCRFPAMARKAQEPRRQRKPHVRPPDGLLTQAEAAARLACSIKTLNGHIASGALRYVALGHGRKRPRRFFTDADLDTFIAAQTRKDVPCPSTASRARHTGISISSGTVIDFTAPRKPPTDDKRKK